MLLLQSQKSQCLAEISAQLPFLIRTVNIGLTALSQTELTEIIRLYVNIKYFPSVSSHSSSGPNKFFCWPGTSFEPYAVKLGEGCSNAELHNISSAKLIELDKLIYDLILNKYRDLKREECIENRVIVRIWNSFFNGGHNVGHVSIELPHDYISLWPKGMPAGTIKQFFEIRPKNLLEEYADDVSAEGRHAEITICLYKLNVQRMKYKFDDVKKNLEGWTLAGPNRLLNNGSAHSCSSLALEILKVSGLELDYAIFSSSVAPDKIAEVIKTAKKDELKKHPETAEFKFDRETYIEPDNYKKSTCSLS